MTLSGHERLLDGDRLEIEQMCQEMENRPFHRDKCEYILPMRYWMHGS